MRPEGGPDTAQPQRRPQLGCHRGAGTGGVSACAHPHRPHTHGAQGGTPTSRLPHARSTCALSKGGERPLPHPSTVYPPPCAPRQRFLGPLHPACGVASLDTPLPTRAVLSAPGRPWETEVAYTSGSAPAL